jgi:hypothetical protein
MAPDNAAHDQKYVSVTGTAVVSNDRARIKQLGEDGCGRNHRLAPQHRRQS